MDSWGHYVAAIGTALTRLAITDKRGQTLSAADGFGRWVEITHEVHARGQHLYLVRQRRQRRDGESFCRRRLQERWFTGPGVQRRRAVDVHRERSRVRSGLCVALTCFARAGDMLITISSSGASPNILRALEQARDMQLQVVKVSGKAEDNPSRTFGDLNFYIPTARYGVIESIHHVVLHYWLDESLDRYGQGAV